MGFKIRRSIRLKGYDYSQAGAYFITICTHERKHLFGKITVGANGRSPDIDCSPDIDHSSKIILNEYGKIVQREWEKSAKIRSEIILDQFIVMPNHIHGIVMIDKNDNPIRANGPFRANGRSPLRRMKPKSISSFIAGYKSSVTTQINILRNRPGVPIWQRNYHEHIIRDEKSYCQISEYIQTNPRKWLYDKYNE